MGVKDEDVTEIVSEHPLRLERADVQASTIP